MLRHVAQPLHARRFEADVGVEAASYGAVDDYLLLFLQQLDQLVLGLDVAPNSPVHVIEQTDDSGLLGIVRHQDRNVQQIFWTKCRTDASTELIENAALIKVEVLPKEKSLIPTMCLDEANICWTHNPVFVDKANSTRLKVL